jgi:hypothetical protein
LDYLNNLAPNQFTQLLRNLEGAQRTGTLPEAKQARELILLESISLQPQPFYCIARKSTRLAPVGASLCSLKSEVRKALTSGWVEVDLQNVQLAVN